MATRPGSSVPEQDVMKVGDRSIWDFQEGKRLTVVIDVGYFACGARNMGSSPIREQSRSSSWLGHVQFLRCLFPVK